MRIHLRLAIASAVLVFSGLATAHDHLDDPIKERQSLMKDTRNAAGPVGKMLRGDLDFDADTFMESMNVFLTVGTQYGDLFPDGSEFGNGTEAAPAIWSDRAGFNAALDRWVTATRAAVEAAPQSLDEARPVAGKVFQSCKGCHDNYRVDD
ncbi:MAG: cytochrome c [Pseudomonadota bacterium]